MLDSAHYEQLRHPSIIARLCDRHRGIGADGLISVAFPSNASTDFRMNYHNADGSADCFCGNGARCAVAFAHSLKNLPRDCTFEAFDGIHHSQTYSAEDIEISLRSTSSPIKANKGWFIDTGSRHWVLRVSEPDKVDVGKEGAHWRHHPQFQPMGTNVNFWAVRKDELYVRTYEKGVEAETLACGTGIVAVALVHHYEQKGASPSVQIPISMKGGAFQVQARKTDKGYDDIKLRGPVRHVFTGIITL